MAGRDTTSSKSIGIAETATTDEQSESTSYAEKQLYDSLWNIRRRYVLYCTKHVG